ncbi:MAG: hypothetical protein KIS78_29835 [Labilithrix sp.]|nr:hypothetical protein [Labilithrix sp.]MCW5836636.1 hypothetical protein [Labilithrix sp.]
MSAQPRLVTGLCLLALACAACADKEAADPGAVLREEIVDRVGPPSRATSRTVRCACDADGDLHVSAPQGSRVTVPEDATNPAEAQIVLPEDRLGAPLRRTKSLGFVGDGKLTPSPSRGGPWNVPDALLPPHRHVEPRYQRPSYGYGAYVPGYVPGYAGTPAPAPPPPGWN